MMRTTSSTTRLGSSSTPKATRANRKEEIAITQTMVERVERRFDLRPERLVGDTVYGVARLLKWLVDRNITPHVPVWDKSARHDGIFSPADFVFDQERNVYIFPGGGGHPRRWTDCRLGIDRNLPGFQGWKPWLSTAPTASNSSVRSPRNTLRARPCMRWRSATTCPVILSASGSRSTKLAPSRTTSAQPISCRNTKQRSPLWNAWWGGKRLRSNS